MLREGLGLLYSILSTYRNHCILVYSYFGWKLPSVSAVCHLFKMLDAASASALRSSPSFARI